MSIFASISPQVRRKWFIVGSVILLMLVVALLLVFLLKPKDSAVNCNYCENDQNQTKLGSICSPSLLGKYKKFAVSTDSNVCAKTGKNILTEGGNAVDSIISVLLCMGVTIPESLGLGGGSLIVIYNSTSKKASFINAREAAPFAAYPEMFTQTDVKNASYFGLLSIAVPGELAGYWHIYNKYGSKKISWERLFQDAIKFANKGFPVGQHLSDALEQNRKTIMQLSELRNVYVNKNTGDLYKVGEIMVQEKLGETLYNLSKASNPRTYFYNDIAKKIMNDLNNHNDFNNSQAIISEKDFSIYEVLESEAHEQKLRNNITMYSSKLPGSGVLLSFIMRTMLKFEDLFPNARFDLNRSKLFFHRLVETFKFAFSRRMHLGDDRFDNCTEVLANLTSDKFIDSIVHKIKDQTFPSNSGYYDAEKFQQFDHGTAHVSVLDSDGNAAAVTSTVNLYFGSKVMSKSTGIIMNNEMDDFNTGKPNEFDLPVSNTNKIKSKKRPLSSMTPAIFVDDSGVRLVIGASGGPKIITAVAQASLRHLYLEDDIKMAIDASRLHHQLFPQHVEYEQCFPETILDDLEQRKHQVQMLKKGVRGAIVMGISRSPYGEIEANSDYRKGGSVSGE